MTQSLGVNQNNDIYIGSNGNVVVLQGQAAVQVACSNVSRASLGEEVLNINGGLPFFQAIFVGVPNLPIFENYLRQALLSVDGVIAVTNLTTQVTRNNKGQTVLLYKATIENQFGLTFQASGEIPAP